MIEILVRERKEHDELVQKLRGLGREKKLKLEKMEKELVALKETHSKQKAHYRKRATETTEAFQQLEARHESAERENVSLRRDLFRANQEIERLKSLLGENTPQQ